MNTRNLLPLLALAFVGFGCSKPESNPYDGSTVKTVESADSKAKFKVALLTPGPVTDSGWSALAYDGLKAIQDDMGATVQNKESSGTKIADDMRTYAQQGYNLVFGHGFEYNEPAIKVAKDFPNTVFVSSSGGKTAKNVGAFRFDLEEGFYIAGYMAGLMTKTGTIGSVSVADYPSIVSTLKAYAAGAKAAKSDINVLQPVYFGSEGDVARAKQSAEAVIGQGADFVIHQANAAAQGVFDACKEKKVYAFGSNANQNDNPSGAVIASAIIVTKTPFKELADAVKRKVYSGTIGEYAMSNSAIDFVINPKLVDKIPHDVQQKVQDLAADIKSGKVKVPKDKF
jgi:basic membrane lipoprotein Med (substrate-binding protein (PBP1-ABC) superfamily)